MDYEENKNSSTILGYDRVFSPEIGLDCIDHL